MWMLNLKHKVPTDAEDSHHRYFTCLEAVNLEQTLTVQ